MNSKQLNVGMNRGKARLWIEGRWLADAGFTRGMAYTVRPMPENGMLLIYADPEGSRRVAGTVDRPILDLTKAADMSAIGGSGSIVSLVSPNAGSIIVTKLNTD